MNELMLFRFNGNDVRVVIVNGEPWWVAKDVSDALGYRDAATGTRTLRPNEKGTHRVCTPGGEQEMLIINEPGLYRMVLRSERREAEVFQDWVTGEVLPSIRKNGMYATEELLGNPDLLVEVVTRLRDEHKARKALENKVIELAPKAEFHDRVSEAVNCHGIGDVAKVFKTGRTRFFRWLRAEGILMSDNVPYQQYIDAGYFRVVERVYRTDSGEHVTTTTLVTGKGMTWLEKRYNKKPA